MNTIKTAINSFGLIVTIVGVYMVYHFSPMNFDTIDGGSFDADFKQIERETNRRNSLLRVGVFVVIGGTLLQLLSNFIPSD
jgi:hypothetical protein